MNMCITTYDWRNIYVNRIHNLPINKISEFMYKIFHRLIVSRQTLKKWKRTESELCPICHQVETVKHIYFECNRIQHMWREVGNRLQIEITWKKLLFGYCQDLVNHNARNLVFSIIMYGLFKLWIGSMEDVQKYRNANVCRFIITELKKQTSFFKFSSKLRKNNYHQIIDHYCNNICNIVN